MSVNDNSGSDFIGYILHHLNHWSLGSGFLRVNLDTLLVSIVIGLLVPWALIRYLRHHATEGVPGRFQAALELFAEFSSGLIRGLYPKRNPWAESLTLTYFLWIGGINLLALLPVDLVPGVLGWFGVPHFFLVATCDTNLTLALALSVVVWMFIFSYWANGPKGFFKSLADHPLPHWIFFPINVPLNLVSYLCKSSSLAVRLWLNMFIGEVGSLMIVALSPWFLQWLPYVVWTLFHLLEIPLQAYLFTLIGGVNLSLSAKPQKH